MNPGVRYGVTKPAGLWSLVRRSIKRWSDDDAPVMAAALSYYTVFSIAQLLLIVIGVAGLALGREAASGQVFDELRGLLGDDGASLLQTMLASASAPRAGIIATAVGTATLLLGATTVFVQLQGALDRIWKTQGVHGKGGLRAQVHSRVLSFLLVLGIALLLLVSVIASASLLAFAGTLAGRLGEAGVLLLQVANIVVGAIVITVLFALLYRLLPRARIAWRDVWVGAALTAILFTIGKFLLGIYLAKGGVGSPFGAAGSLAIVLVWVYYSAQIFVLGAEFTWVYAHELGSHRHDGRTAGEAPYAPAAAGRPGGAAAPSHPRELATIGRGATAFREPSSRLELGLAVTMGVVAGLAALVRRRMH